MSRTAGARAARTFVADADQGAVIADFMSVLAASGMATTGRPALVAASGERLEVPEAVYDVLVVVAESLAGGMGVSVAPLSALLTTQEAADYLGVSRPTLVRILERGEIAMEKPGRHRLVRLQDLVTYQENSSSRRRAALADMVADAEADDLYARTDRPAPAMR